MAGRSSKLASLRNQDIALHVRDQKTGQESRYRVDKSLQLRKLMEIYCNVMSVDRNALVFSFDGCSLDADMSINQLQLKDGDKIDALLQQRISSKDVAETNQNSNRSLVVDTAESQTTSSKNKIQAHDNKNTKTDGFASIRHQQKQQQSQINSLLEDRNQKRPEQSDNQLEKKLDTLLSIIQQQQAVIDTLLRHQQENGRHLEIKMDSLHSVQQQQQCQIDTFINSITTQLGLVKDGNVDDDDDDDDKGVKNNAEDVDMDREGTSEADEDGFFVLV